jgi:ribosomal protein S18 acetylase RimI-like enzyme
MRIQNFNSNYQKKAEDFIKEIFKEMNWQTTYLYGIDNIQNTFGGNRDIFLIVVDKGRIKGCVGLKKLSKEKALIKRFYLSSSLRGKGIAQNLFKKLKIFALDKGYKYLVLDTQKDNYRAQAFYEKTGFKAYQPKFLDKWPESKHPEIFKYYQYNLKENRDNG